MVNTINTSIYSGELPSQGESREIANGPLYSAKDISSILENGVQGFKMVTRRCLENVEDLSLSHEDVLDLLKLCVKAGKYRNSVWCDGSTSGTVMACDAYVVERTETMENIGKDFTISYYLKFAIGKTGQILMLVSCHTS